MAEEQREGIQLPSGLLAGRPQGLGTVPRLAAQGQIVREWVWWERTVVGLGLAWPFLIALCGLGLTAAGVNLSDPLASFLLFSSFLGVPVAIAALYRWLPTSWPEACRFLLAMLLGPPCVLGEIFLALILFAFGYVMVGGYVP
jgi:hypothetical protein